MKDGSSAVLRSMALALFVTPAAHALARPAGQGEDLPLDVLIGGPGRQVGNAVHVGGDGDLVVVGYTDGEGAGANDVYVVRTNAAGAVRWSTTFGGPADDFGWDILPAPGGGFFVLGYTASWGAGEDDVWLARLDPRGREIWSRTFGGPGGDRAWAFVEDGAGGFVVAGEGSAAGQSLRHAYLLRLTAHGEVVWEKRHGGPGEDRVYDLARTIDGGFVFVGTTTTNSSGQRDAYVLKTDAMGEIEWEQRFGGAQDDVAHGVIALASGDLLVTGYGASFGPSSNGYDVALWRLEPDGKVRWRREAGNRSDDRAIMSARGGEGVFWAIGYSIRLGRPYPNATLTRYTLGGEVLERRLVSRSTPGRGVHMFTLPGGGWVATGTKRGTSGDDLWIFGSTR